jgi:hypothetical protein
MTKNSDFPLYVQIMNISMNMARIGGWVADSYESKKELIPKFIQETEGYLTQLKTQNIAEEFKPTLEMFTQEFTRLNNEPINEKNKLHWAEKSLTWANILQARARLA